MKYDIFISYAHKDEEWATRLAQTLRQQDLRVFDYTEIKPGEIWAEKMEEALRESKYVVMVTSNQTVNSNFAAVELGAALALKKPLIPVLTEDIALEMLPSPIRARQYLIRQDPVQTARQIVEVVSEAKNGGGEKQPA